MNNADDIKKQLGIYAADYVKNGMTIGLGTGTTVYWLLQELGKRVQEGLQFTAVPTSAKTKEIGEGLGIKFKELDEVDELAIAIDGADEVDKNFQLIKGGGAALLQEKIVEAATKNLIIIVDERKMVDTLGKFPLPVEVITFGWAHVQKRIQSLGCKKVDLRLRDNQPLLTDHQHYILDCYFDKIDDPISLNTTLHNIPGVVETGLFINMASEVITGYNDGSIISTKRPV
jgi:ribose 5-phosphate isomerase A